ncbi:hypothetical protein ANN_14608 [Periplaneta americana]|uniref:Endonuclease-reverse transcriptase n=1 Tax=Periplaneta americana TaxID=6978 RepID=A0ABQ8SY56_PERAM|nr:hypothetical protein ANN_14608 [Periplaneta americana]
MASHTRRTAVPPQLRSSCHRSIPATPLVVLAPITTAGTNNPEVKSRYFRNCKSNGSSQSKKEITNMIGGIKVSRVLRWMSSVEGKLKWKVYLLPPTTGVILEAWDTYTRNGESGLSRRMPQASARLKEQLSAFLSYILPVVLYGCEAWTLTLRDEQRLRVFKNKVLRKIFGAKRNEVTGEWRKLHNAELHALYSSPDIIRNIKSRRLRWEGHVARMGESRNAYRVLVGRPAGKRPLGRPRRRWEDNIKMDLREVGYDGRDWINLAQDRDQWRAYVRAAMNLRIP